MIGVSDVTQRTAGRLVLRLTVVLAVLVAALIVALTVLGPFGDRQASSLQGATESLAERVPGAVLPEDQAPEVLPAVDEDAPEVSATKLTRRMRSLISAAGLGDSVSVDVLDPASGEHLLSRDIGTARTPASSQKLLTGTAVLSAVGAQSTLTTSTVLVGRTVYLVGGGDVLLGAGQSDDDAVDGHAGLATLAEQTAEALSAAGVTGKVRVRLDDSLFEGPTTAVGWDDSDVSDGYVAPVNALEISAGRLEDGDYVARSQDPAMAAAQTFAEALGDQGVRVVGSLERAEASDDASELAEVQSATIGDQVEYALTHSDNTVAEALGRMVAVARGTAVTFPGAGRAVLAQLREDGISVKGATLVDTSGLSPENAVPAWLLTAVLALAGGDGADDLRPVLTGMPIAGVSGTLEDRFEDDSEEAATGLVRAKTGTLSGVSSLAGTVVDEDGRLLVFAVMADQVPSTTAAREALDAFASGLVGCGC